MTHPSRPSDESSAVGLGDRARDLDDAARAIDWDHTPGCFLAASKILRDADCSLGTASHLFWAAQPREVQHRDLADVDHESDLASQWRVIREVLLGVANQRFRNTIAYDPASEWDVAEVSFPSTLLSATPGAEPVVWRQHEDIESMWDEELRNTIDEATNTEDLFNITMFLDEPAPLEAVLDHRAIDTGTALLAYWRLRHAARLWNDALPLLERAEDLVLSGKLIPRLRYDPAQDPRNAELLGEQRWSIPDELRLPTGNSTSR